MRDFFRRSSHDTPESVDGRSHEVPGDLWIKCLRCRELIYVRELERNKKVCHKCGYHFRLSAQERIDFLLDEDSFEELAGDLATADPLQFVANGKPYPAKLCEAQEESKLKEAVLCGTGLIEAIPVIAAVCDFSFIGASMGSVFGEKIARSVEAALDRHRPLLTVSASGGARMQEGLFSLMQMAKTAASLARLGPARLPHLSLLTDPTSGGVTASYASLADVILAEPGAFIGFAGPRIVEQITKQKLPAGALSNNWVTLHQDGNPAGFKPILIMDVWEHAFLLDYKPAERPKYIDAFFQNLDWNILDERLASEKAVRPIGQ